MGETYPDDKDRQDSSDCYTCTLGLTGGFMDLCEVWNLDEIVTGGLMR